MWAWVAALDFAVSASSVVIVDVYFAGVGMFDRGRTTSTVFAMILLVVARLHF